MAKRIYRATHFKNLDANGIAEALDDKRVVLGCDAAKHDWKAALMTSDGRVLHTVKWTAIDDHGVVMSFVIALRSAGVKVTVAMEPPGTYADAIVYQLQQAQFEVFCVSSKHSHDYSEIYDGVPSSHDGKSAAVVA